MTVGNDDNLDKEIGQLLMCGFDGLEPTPGIIDLIENHNLGSIILFSRNIATPKQVQKLTHSLQQIARNAGHKRPLFIAVDQENGVVRRLGDSGTYLPGNMALGALGSSTAARNVAMAISKELLTLGMNWNLAPVLDVNNNPLNPVIGVRSYGQDPELVARMGLAQVEGYQRGKVATSIKHFPGHGDTATDSHLDVPVINKTLEELDKTELVPFKKALEAGGIACPTSVMVGHMLLPHFNKDVVSSIAPEIVRDLLRRRFGYKGVIITDCLEMDAVKETVGTPKGALMALQAGNDMAMISHTLAFQKDAFKVLYSALQEGQLDKDEIRQSLQRVAQLKDQFLNWDDVLQQADLKTMGSEAHATLSKELYDRVPTVVTNRKNTLPIRPAQTDKILFLAAHVPQTLAVDSEKEPFNSFHASLLKRHTNLEYIIYNEETPDLSQKIQEADWVIIGTANANLYPFQVRMVQQAQKLAKRLVVAAVMNPYDQMCFPQVDTYLVTYEYTPPAHEAAVRLIFGEIETRSRLPISIPNVDDAIAPATFIVDDYRNDDDLDHVTAMWDDIFGKDWPLRKDKINLGLQRAKLQKHKVARDSQGKIVGFVATQIVVVDNKKHGQLMLLMVSPSYQGKGVGTLLHDAALEHFREQGADCIKLGSTYPRFFPGVPDDDAQSRKAQAFFSKKGWRMDDNLVHDLIGDLQDYKVPDKIQARMLKEKIWFGRIKPSETWELYAFQQRNFPHWLSTYQHHVELGDYQDLIVARQDDENGRVIASLILNTTHVSHEYRSDLIWTDDKLFGERSGGMACVGVAQEERGRGIGIGIVAHANWLLKQRGVTKSYVDWVELLDFYSRVGYKTWRSYRLGHF
uniref:N-acetyl-beta-D glucosaminidase n=1 Tax=Rhizomucor miehei TaxID=4839 RepID=V9M3A9_RHIMI|nr:N-acetyl-beta-D glucosaminidase [Rhizomucor miehei]4ZM6_A Chain A, N-acetyl-beta-D glucosaminidase [Rhizomucor miehei CAU432]4ZM6_B Chain B, N-acetyl-beta-D glucosaminidase [Rhizomucor miehei CAU432]